MRLPSFKRLFKQDFQQEFREFVDRLSVSYNSGIEVLYDLANNKISFKDNILSVVKDVTLTVNANGIPTNTASVTLDGIVRTPIGCFVVLATNLTTASVFPTSQPFVTFTQNENSITINHVSGLPAGNSFLLRLIIIG